MYLCLFSKNLKQVVIFSAYVQHNFANEIRLTYNFLMAKYKLFFINGLKNADKLICMVSLIKIFYSTNPTINKT